MKGRWQFTRKEAEGIRQLLRRKVRVAESEQKRVRDRLRHRFGFYISDFGPPGFTIADFDELVESGRVEVVDQGSATGVGAQKQDSGGEQANAQGPTAGGRPGIAAPGESSGVHESAAAQDGVGRDEGYVVDLCDEVLGYRAHRQHRFAFLVGDAGTALPVDAYYEELRLVVEYRERQHTEQVKLFDRRMTVSGVTRGEQRQEYDERRRQMLPARGIQLVEINCTALAHTKGKRLKREREHDLEVLRTRLARWIQR